LAEYSANSFGSSGLAKREFQLCWNRPASAVSAVVLEGRDRVPRTRLTMGQLRQIYFWARDEIGVRAPMVGRIAKGEPGPSGVTYPVTVTNNGVPGKGVIAEGLTISLTIPADTTVVAATGTGYQGVHTDDETKATVATWKLPRSAPKDQEKLSITLSKAATAAADLNGDIRWTKPSPKSGPSTDAVNIAPAPL
jgi:hypothetical protein